MSTAYLRTIKKIVIHHMGAGVSPLGDIRSVWNPYHYDYPEYDYGVQGSGYVLMGRPLTIEGAHCISDNPKYMYGPNWWNRNSIGIGLMGDFTKFTMPYAQFYSLVVLVKRLMLIHGLTLDDVYPHGQVTYSDCAGCTYSKVPALTKGKWSYDEFEKAVLL